MKATNVVSISAGRKRCQQCEEQTAELRRGLCFDCGSEQEGESVIDAAMLAEELGMCPKCFMEQCRQAADMIISPKAACGQST